MDDPATARPGLMTDRTLRWRWWLLSILAACFAVLAGGHGDWDQFVAVGKDLFGAGGLHVYARHSDAQTGPISLVLARLLSLTPRDGFVANVFACALLGLGLLWYIERHTPHRTRRSAQLMTFFGGAIMLFSWAKLGGYGHLDDALVLSGAVVASYAALEGRRLSAAVILGLTVAVKPWAVLFLPLTLAGADDGHDDGSIRQRWTPPLLAAAIAGVIWMPFVLAEPKTLQSIRPTVDVARDSVLHLLGVRSASIPEWLRPAQLLAGLVIALVLVERRRVPGVVMAAVAMRLATDPGTWSYYTAGIVIGALVLEQRSTTLEIPFTTFAAAVLVAPTWLVPWADARAVMRLVAAVLAVFVAFRFGAVSAPAPSAGPTRPTSDPPEDG
jgi:hypothetical protein